MTTTSSSPADPRVWERVKELFSAAYEATPADRRRILDEGAGDDPALRQRVEALLDAHDHDGGVLDTPVLALVGGLDPGLLEPATLVGRQLGPYRVTREIGRGGMGAVYEGIREDRQFEQRVAIKTLQSAMGSEGLRRRFEQERRILAGLQHPHIAALYDGGVTDDGLPYFVLEYVDGLPIDLYCHERTLGVAARLELFRQVADAVQYAHRQLVVHRDLKPGNILVTGDGVVKLVDFGVAKLLETDRAEQTLDVLAPLTVAYASPEQVRGEPVTTASDIYSLGVVLYRLLTGASPLDVDRTSLERAITTISQVVPRAPSQTATADAAREMGLEPERLRRALQGDLDAIVMTALRKEPERRYATVQALGDDIDRYRRGLPVTAAPDSAMYRARKFVRRQRALVAGVAVAAVALVAGASVAAWQARTARREAVRATRIASFLQGVLSGNVSSIGSTRRLPQANLTLQEVLDTAARHLPRDLAEDPAVRAILHETLGAGYLAATRVVPAREQYDSALAIHERLRGASDTAVIGALMGVAEVLGVVRQDSAELVSRRALAILDRHRVPDTSVTRIAVLQQLATWLSFQGKLAAAESTFLSLIAAERARANPRLATIGVALGAVGLARHNQGRMDGAESAMREGIAMLDSARLGPTGEQASRLFTFGTHLNSKGKAAEAVEVLRRASEMATVTFPPSNPIHMQTRMALADALSQHGDTATAHDEARRALAMASALPPGSELYRLTAEYSYARMLRRERRWPEAEAAARQQYATGIRAAANVPYYLADVHYMLGGVLSDRGKFAEAERRLTDAYTIARDRLGASNFRATRAARELATLYLRAERLADAGRFLALLPPAVADSVREKVGGEARARNRPTP